VKIRNLQLFSLLLIFIVSCQVKETRESIFNFENEKFSIGMPGKPVENSQNITLNNISIAINYFSYLDSTNNVTYFLSYNDYPIGFEIKNSSDLIQNSINGLLKNSRGKLINSVDIKQQGFTGKQISIKLESGNLLNMQLILVKRRLYQLGIEVPDSVVLETQPYFNTFKIKEKENNKQEADNEKNKIEVKLTLNQFKINNEDLIVKQNITKSFDDFSGELPVKIGDNTITYKLYFIDNRATEFKSLLLFNIYYSKGDNMGVSFISEGIIPITSSEFESSYKTIVNNNQIDFNYTIKLRDI
jgi:hypothetical protein